MCLDKITKKYRPPTTEEQVAWKIVQYGYLTPYNGTILTSEWQKAKQVKIYTESWKTREIGIYPAKEAEPYQSGFHCFKTEEQAQKALSYFRKYSSGWGTRIVKVLVRGVYLEGTDGTVKTNGSDPKWDEMHLENLVALEIKLAQWSAE